MTTVTLRKGSPAKTSADAVLVGVVKTGDGVTLADGADDVTKAFGKGFDTTLTDLKVRGDVGEITRLPGGGAVKARIVVLVGLGEDPDDAESVRRAVGTAVRSLTGYGTVAVALPASEVAQVRAITDGALLGAYSYRRYLSGDQPESVGEVVVLTDLARKSAAKDVVQQATVVAEAVNAARDWVNTPPRDLTPPSFADEISARAKGTPVKVSVLDDKQLVAQGYGGILGVGMGSAAPPRLVTLTYAPRGAKAHLALVGKGITFDSGGLSLKPGPAMMTMKCDMAGAAAIVSATVAIARLGLPVKVTAYAALAENMPSGSASRPGDVLHMYGGKTVEVLNTDAEGRLVLADAITTASKQRPDLIVDVATLTGACVMALGHRTSGIMSNDEQLLFAMRDTATAAGEVMWPLPIPEEMHQKVRTTKIADLSQHNPERVGGALYAAAFLREFVGDGIPWAHLDIAGTAFSDAAHGYTPKGGTGAAVRTLVQLAVERSS